MKEIHLIYNSLNEGYILYYSKDKNEKSRIELGKYDTAGLLNELTHRFDLKRKTLLHVLNIPEETLFRLNNRLSGTKIRVIKETK